LQRLQVFLHFFFFFVHGLFPDPPFLHSLKASLHSTLQVPTSCEVLHGIGGGVDGDITAIGDSGDGVGGDGGDGVGSDGGDDGGDRQLPEPQLEP